MTVVNTSPKSLTGRLAYQSGLAAEDSVRRYYEDKGYVMVEERCRGPAGEIDLIFKNADEYVFVEVKKSRSFEGAAARLSPRQLGRIGQSAQDYMGRCVSDPFANCRLDLAMVDGAGRISTLENLWLS